MIVLLGPAARRILRWMSEAPTSRRAPSRYRRAFTDVGLVDVRTRLLTEKGLETAPLLSQETEYITSVGRTDRP